jgi:allantoicase
MTQPNVEYAYGYNDAGEEIVGTRKMFPAFAAGASGSSKDMMTFLEHLANAFQSLDGSGPISHDTAVTMLFGADKGSVELLGSKMALGLSTIEAEQNKFAIYHGSNDGFRTIFLYCFDGPDKSAGLTVFSNSESNGVVFNSEISQIILQELNIHGIDFQMFNSHAEKSVILDYKNLICEAFKPNLPEKVPRILLDPLTCYNLAVDGRILFVSNQKFARAENLLSNYLPTFDPALFGVQGKIMDSWETVRHNQLECDTLIFELKIPSKIVYVSISTKYHYGNQAQSVKLEGFDGEWKTFVPKMELSGHSIKKVKSIDCETVFSKIRVSLYPDGGLTRIGLFSDNLPENEKEKFQNISDAPSILFEDVIPKSLKPLVAPYHPSKDEIDKNWRTLKPGCEFDVSSMALGGKIISTSNEHYGPSFQIISPFSPIHMFDGFESARSRILNNHEEVVIELGKKSAINRFVSLVPLFSLLEEKISFLPSGENIGNESNIPSNVTCSKPVPSGLTDHRLKGKPLFEA